MFTYSDVLVFTYNDALMFNYSDVLMFTSYKKDWEKTSAESPLISPQWPNWSRDWTGQWCTENYLLELIFLRQLGKPLLFFSLSPTAQSSFMCKARSPQIQSAWHPYLMDYTLICFMSSSNGPRFNLLYVLISWTEVQSALRPYLMDWGSICFTSSSDGPVSYTHLTLPTSDGV